ncbi:MAG: chemotaxis protein CheW [Desulfobacterales bacterium]|nr:chemotaxis protein CheW [Desulfobacterales bacterium]
MDTSTCLEIDENDEFEEIDELFDEYQPINLQMEMSVDGTQWVTFKLQEETYGIDILKVQELIGYSHITHLPNMPPFFKGMLNLRGHSSYRLTT